MRWGEVRVGDVFWMDHGVEERVPCIITDVRHVPDINYGSWSCLKFIPLDRDFAEPFGSWGDSRISGTSFDFEPIYLGDFDRTMPSTGPYGPL